LNDSFATIDASHWVSAIDSEAPGTSIPQSPSKRAESRLWYCSSATAGFGESGLSLG
jgi:hypothetical protein